MKTITLLAVIAITTQALHAQVRGNDNYFGQKLEMNLFFMAGKTINNHETCNELANKYPAHIKNVRGQGLMLGAELHYEGESIVHAMRDHGILINCTNRNVLRFLPPLIIKTEHVDHLINELDLRFEMN